MTDRRKGTGPFFTGKPEPLFDCNGEAVMGVRVQDQTGAAFAYVHQDDCHGMDGPAAKARAQRIAESLNKTEGHLANVERLVEAAREQQKWRSGAGKDSRFDHERQLDEALEPFSEMGEQ